VDSSAVGKLQEGEAGARASEDDDFVHRLQAAAVVPDQDQPVAVAFDGLGAETGDGIGVPVVDGCLGGQAEGAAGGELVGGAAAEGSSR
jgi:hypothetical protein